MANLLASISGYKTYIATVAWVAFEILNARHALGLDADTAQLVRASLLGVAGLSLRHGVAKAEDAANDAAAVTIATAPSKN